MNLASWAFTNWNIAGFAVAAVCLLASVWAVVKYHKLYTGPWQRLGLLAVAAAAVLFGVSTWSATTKPAQHIWSADRYGGFTEPNAVVNGDNTGQYGAAAAAIILQNLSNPAALRSWHMCGAELRGEAHARHGSGLAFINFPHNRPYNYNVANSIAQGQQQLRHATLFMQAAVVADGAKVACDTQISRPPWHWATVHGFYRGKGYTVKATDLDVMQNATSIPVMLYENWWERQHSGYQPAVYCPRELSSDLASAMKQPVDKHLDANGFAVGQYQVAYNVVQLQADTNILRQAHLSLKC